MVPVQCERDPLIIKALTFIIVLAAVHLRQIGKYKVCKRSVMLYTQYIYYV